MLEKNLQYFNIIDILTETHDTDTLLYFIDNRLNELFSLLKTQISDKEEENEFLKLILMNDYSFDYKGKSLDEVAADICTLIGFLEIVATKKSQSIQMTPVTIPDTFGTTELSSLYELLKQEREDNQNE